jgi:hypothetical protein
VPAAIIDGNLRRWEGRVGKRPNCDAHRIVVTFFGMEDSSPANRAKAKSEPGSLIAGANVLDGGAEDFERSREASQYCEDTACPLLASEAVANANSSWFAFDLNAQLSAGASGCSGRH